VVDDDDLSQEAGCFYGWVVLGVRADKSSLELLNGEVLNVESNVVSWDSFRKSLVVHFNRFNFGGKVGWGENDDHTGFQDISFNTSDGHSSDTTDLVYVLKGNSEGLLSGSLRCLQGIKSFKEGWALVPGEVGGLFKHVVTVPF